MVLLESEQFLTELTRLFQKCRTSGSVYITLKKYDGRTKPIPRKGHVEGFEPADNKCLLRATDGKKKISTVVSSKEVNKFQMVSNPTVLSAVPGVQLRYATVVATRVQNMLLPRSHVSPSLPTSKQYMKTAPAKDYPWIGPRGKVYEDRAVVQSYKSMNL
ncbi:signal recognition particle 14 kDa protein isoform X2 [Chrysemys picta bellii]|uniref:signal recognition particle 14 kDa protein isoform X2 n=1 Tax=Chrysemys picta bellii TaxID=8478 RepID=UPI0032B243D1